MKRLALIIVKKRAAILSLIVAATLGFAYLCIKIEMYTAFADLLPTDHPYIRVHNRFWKTAIFSMSPCWRKSKSSRK
jgi:uncharacterized protein